MRHYLNHHHQRRARGPAEPAMEALSPARPEEQHCSLCRNHCPVSKLGCEKGRDFFA